MTTTITLRQAELLLAFFGGHDAEVTVAAESPGLSPGLYAWLTEYPAEGSQYLGPTEVDDELADKGRPLKDAGLIGEIVASTGEFGYQVVQWSDHYRPRIGDRLALCLPAHGPLVAKGSSAGWRDMATAPKDGTMLRLLVEFEHHATEDGEGPQATIGSNTWDNHHDFDRWQFAGWNWEQDCYTQGIGKPVGWLPMLDAAEQGGAKPQHSRAVLDVLVERNRQTSEKGWTPEHDDGHVNDEIAAFACFYAMPPGAREWPASETGYGDTLGAAIVPEGWAARPGDRRRELVKAAALVLAEIERLDRAAIQTDSGQGKAS